tara:strand:- start:1933 stop:2118 length:186 start_codon:yes stop_codon:yes gene_type:complete
MKKNTKKKIQVCTWYRFEPLPNFLFFENWIFIGTQKIGKKLFYKYKKEKNQIEKENRHDRL